MGTVLREQLNTVIDGVARKYHPDVWAVLPQRVKDEIVNKVRHACQAAGRASRSDQIIVRGMYG